VLTGHGVKRLTDPALAGGALLDVGVYPINFAMMVFGNNIESIESSCIKTDSGVDESNSITLTFKGDKWPYCTPPWSAPRTVVEPSSAPGGSSSSEYQQLRGDQRIRQGIQSGGDLQTFKFITGFEHQVEACRKAIEEGALECKQMPHSEIIKVMK
jgi:predicted dehydrogenase